MRGIRVYEYASWRPRMTEATIAVITCGVVFGIAGFAVHGAARYAILSVGGVVTAASVRRAFRLSFRATKESVSIRNFWRTFEFSWSEVEAVGVMTLTMGVTPMPAVGFLLRDGRGARAQATPWKRRERADMLAQLAEIAPEGVRVDLDAQRFGLRDLVN